MATCRLILDLPATGVYNMAVDEMLLWTASDTQQQTLRFYRWRPATLSLGYFQKLSDRALHAGSKHCDVVRRATGGGAIVHDHELTYCYAIPSQDRFGSAEHLYRAFHETLAEALAEAGVDATLHNQRDGSRDDTFLCFQRRSQGDLLFGGHKIGGSAQRRRQNALVQHGSVLLERSDFAPELPGLRNLCKFEVSTDWLTQAWLARLGPRLKTEFRIGDLSDDEKQMVTHIAKDKFAHGSWTARR